MVGDAELMISIRSALESDWPCMQRIESEAFFKPERVLAERIADSRRKHHGPLFVPTYVDVAVVKACSGDVVAGYVAWSYEPFGACEKCIHVMNLAVSVEFRRFGIATQLLRHVHSLSREKFPQAVCVRLIVRADNAAAHQLYLQVGFRRADFHANYYDDADGIELHQMLDGQSCYESRCQRLSPERSMSTIRGKRPRRQRQRAKLYICSESQALPDSVSLSS